MKARTNRGRALMAGTAVAACCVTGFTAAHAETTGTQPAHPHGEAHFWLDPATVEAPGPIVVRGTGCVDAAGTSGEVFVRVSSEGGPVVETTTVAQPGGDWTVSLMLPPGVTTADDPALPGADGFPVSARCDPLAGWGDEPGFDYGVATVTVASPSAPPAPTTPPAPEGKPAKPVKAKPHYTG